MRLFYWFVLFSDEYVFYWFICIDLLYVNSKYYNWCVIIIDTFTGNLLNNAGSASMDCVWKYLILCYRKYAGIYAYWH